MTEIGKHLDNDTSYDDPQRNNPYLENTGRYAVYDNPHTGAASLGPLVERQPNRGPAEKHDYRRRLALLLGHRESVYEIMRSFISWGRV